VLDPSLHTTTIQLQPSAPGQFGGSFQESSQGAYFITVEARGGGHAEAGQIGMDVPYSPEYRTVGVDRSFLRQLAAAGGGGVISRPQDAWSDNLPSVLAAYDLRAWLLLLALLLLPIDIGVRRLVVSREELAALVAALPWRRPPTPAPEAAVATLAAVRARRARRGQLEPQPVRDAAMGMERSWDVASLSGSGPVAQRSPSPIRPSTASGVSAETDISDDESTASKLLRARRRRRS
jgi:hypothetical protein